MTSLRFTLRRLRSRADFAVRDKVAGILAGRAIRKAGFSFAPRRKMRAGGELDRGENATGRDGRRMVKVWAHRGASAYAPENTLESFALAAKMKADGVELDVHLSKDGEVIVCHDEKIDRTSNGKGAIAEMTYEQLLGYSFDNGMPEYAGAKVPTLRQVYQLLEPAGLTVNVELKTDNTWYEGIEEKCLAIARECGMTDRVLYSSFNHKSLQKLLSLDPNAQTGLLYYLPLGTDDSVYAVEQKAFAVHPHWKFCHVEGYMESMKAKGVRVHPWTVDDPEEMRALIDLGVDALITDKPDVALKVLGR